MEVTGGVRVRSGVRTTCSRSLSTSLLRGEGLVPSSWRVRKSHVFSCLGVIFAEEKSLNVRERVRRPPEGGRGVVGRGRAVEFLEEEGGVEVGDDWTREKVRLVGVTECFGDGVVVEVRDGISTLDFGVVGWEGVEAGWGVR